MARMKALAVLAVLVVSCGRGDPPDAGGDVPAAEAELEVARVTFHRAEPDVREPGGFFGSDDELVARVETRGRAEQATLIVDWKTKDGRVIGHSSRSITPDSVEVTEFHLSSPESWPVGDYELAVWLNGRLAASRSFTIGAGE